VKDYKPGDRVVMLYSARLGDFTLLSDGTRVAQRRDYVPAGFSNPMGGP